MSHSWLTARSGALLAIHADNIAFKKVSIGRAFPCDVTAGNIWCVNSIQTYSSIKVYRGG